jgi:hypothetical protein
MRPIAAILFVVSTAFPVAAGVLTPRAAPAWMGVADVALAAVLLAVGLAIVARAPKAFDAATTAMAFRVLRASSALFLVLLVLFFLVGGAIDWPVLLIGLAWRAWLFVLVLPSWLALR